MITQTLTKADILGADDRKPIEVKVPEWGGVVYVRPLSGTDRDQLEAWQTAGESVVGFRAQLVSRCLCDGSGDSLRFSPAEVQELGEKSAAALERLVAVAMRSAAYTQAEVEELEGNSPSVQSGDSG